MGRGDQAELFHMEPVQLPEGPGGPRKKWGGRQVAKARNICRAMLPAACWRGCGRVITPDWPERDWHAGHINGRAEGGEDTAANYLPECRWCNTSEGGKLGAAITNGRKTSIPDVIRERTIKWY